LRWEKRTKDFHNLNQILTKRTYCGQEIDGNEEYFTVLIHEAMHAMHIKFSFREMDPESTKLKKGKGRKCAA
jgi:hypothetical protein